MMNNSSFFANTDCEYYPCHKTNSNINCMFCFCPLYIYDDCGGNYTKLSNKIKDCSKCTLPHQEGGYNHVILKLFKKGGR